MKYLFISVCIILASCGEYTNPTKTANNIESAVYRNGTESKMHLVLHNSGKEYALTDSIMLPESLIITTDDGDIAIESGAYIYVKQ